MGYFSRLHAELEDFLSPDDSPENEFEDALASAKIKLGETNKFFRSCEKFYYTNGFLTAKQIEALNNPRY